MVQTTAFLRSLERRDSLSDEEVRVINDLPGRPAVFNAGEEIVMEGSRPKDSCLVTSGFAARSQSLRSGETQITAVHVPGDFVDLHSMVLKVMDHSVVALGPCKVAFVPHEKIKEVTERSPHLARLFWMSTTIDGAIQRTWITCLGRRSAEQHLAHLICELYVRLEGRWRRLGLHLRVSRHAGSTRRRSRPVGRACESQAAGTARLPAGRVA